MRFAVTVKEIKYVKDEVVVLGLFEKAVKLPEDVSEIDRASAGVLKKIISSGDFRGKPNQSFLFYPEGGLKTKRILLIGLGKEDAFTLDRLRGAAATAARAVRELSLDSFTLPLAFAGAKRFSNEENTRALIEGVLLGLYEFRMFKSRQNEDDKKDIRVCNILIKNSKDSKKVRAEVKRTEAVVSGVYVARDLVSMPGNKATPSFLAETAKKTARKYALKCSVLNEQKAKSLGMEAYLGVARGSEERPKFIVLEHNPQPKKKKPVFVLIGKAVTFDSGGISLKPANKMEEMKTDMAGGAVVIAVLQVCAQLKLPLNVVGIVPAAENLPSGHACKPGDVLKSMSGKTIEIISTDAEGRLLLADALTYASRYKPSAVIDIATLTGGAIIALGNDVAAVMGNDDSLIEIIRKAGEKTGERLWQLPLWEEYKDLLKSDIADIKNSGGRPASTITGGYFLREFVKDFPWVHIDIAGTAWSAKEKAYIPKGATGFGVRFLVEFLEKWKK